MLAPIDFSSAAGRELLAEVAARHGEAFASLARLSSRFFALHSAAAPGLGFVGALAETGGHTFSLGGTGETLADALTTCLGEAVERLSQVERAGDVSCRGAIAEIRNRLLPSAETLIGELGVPEAMLSGVADWIAAADLVTGREVVLPADWCLRRLEPGRLNLPNTALSTGVAAGATPEAAAGRGLLELVERDAVALWWIGGRRGRPVALDDPAIVRSAALLARLRQGVRTRSSWLLDLTSDLGIPCVAAVSVSLTGDHLACGTAARLSIETAARAAILEMCQMELAVEVVNLKRAERGEAALNETDRRHLRRSTAIDAAHCELLQPSGVPRGHDLPRPVDAASELEALRERFARAGIAAVLVDLTRPDYGIPVMAAVAPTLQRLPSDVHVERLTATIAATGGGARWTRGAALV